MADPKQALPSNNLPASPPLGDAGPSTVGQSNPHDAIPIEGEKLHHALDSAQLQKCWLEIEQLKQTRHDRLNRSLPWITAMLALATLAWQTYSAYVTALDNFHKEYWSRQLVVYEAAIDLASKLSTEEAGAARDVDFKSFTELYYGKLVIYEDPTVEKAMVNFRESYLDYERNPGRQNDVQHAVRDLANECRKSAAKTWGQEYTPVRQDGQ